MKPQLWLAELHRQWRAARGRSLTPSARPFFREWNRLLDDAGILPAEDRHTALREAEALEKQGRLQLRRHKYRNYLMERIVLPTDSAPWLRALFDTPDPAALRAASLAVIHEQLATPHARYPQLWAQWCDHLAGSFSAGRSVRPFKWTRPDALRHLLKIVRQLTERSWEYGTPIRTASVRLGLDSKELERRQHSIESALTQLFGPRTPLEALGILTSSSHVWMSGPLILHYDDGTDVDLSSTRGRYALGYEELSRAVSLTTTAQRLLSVENLKDTFPHLAHANRAQSTLLAATSFPTLAMRLLMQKLPPGLPHLHFGDTDPAGWAILLSLRSHSPRPIAPFLMRWRPSPSAGPLTEYDLMHLQRLLHSSMTADCHAQIQPMLDSGQRGDFEQESLGPPDFMDWPFYSAAL